MDVKVSINKAKGEVTAKASKSQAHRHLICSALSDSPNFVKIRETSQDIDATVTCLNALGAHISRTEEGFTVTPIKAVTKNAVLDCNESGSTFRFLLPLACALNADASFIMKPGLAKRPITQLHKQLIINGCDLTEEGKMPLTAYSQLKGGTFLLSGDVSSQYITGLLMSLPILKEQSIIKLTSKLESSGYVDMTIDVLIQYGINVKHIKDGYVIPENQCYHSMKETDVENDWSNAAFFLCAGALSHDAITVEGLNTNSYQKDKSIIDILLAMGADIKIEKHKITVKNNALKAVDIDASEIPDLVPVLSLVATAAEGTTKIYNAKRLRIKECDRLASTYEMLKTLGADIEVIDDSLIIRGKGILSGGTVYSYNDHRIAMTAAIASIVCKEPVIIKDAQAVNKSYPSFFDDFKKIGGNVKIICGGNDVFCIW